MRFTLCILSLVLGAMAFAGPAESHHDQHCANYQPNPHTTCRRH